MQQSSLISIFFQFSPISSSMTSWSTIWRLFPFSILSQLLLMWLVMLMKYVYSLAWSDPSSMIHSMIHMSLAFPDTPWYRPEHYLSVCLPGATSHLLLLASGRSTLDHPQPSSMHTLLQTHNQIPLRRFFTQLQTGTFAKVFQFGTLVRSK